MPPPGRRSIFADRLGVHADFAFGNEAVFARSGTWADFFRQRIGAAFKGRVVLEIGCADGAFLATLAAKHPATGFVGLDWKHKSLFLAAQRVAAAGLPNVGLLRGRGQDITAFFAEGELDEILVLHPDPFATPAELPNRLISERFLIDAHRVLRDAQSILTLKTDHPGYYAWTLALLGRPEPAHFAAARARAVATPELASRLQGVPRIRADDLTAPADLPARSEAVAECFSIAACSADFWNDPAALAHTAGRCFAGQRTFFEQRFLKKRQPIYYVELRKH